MTVLPCRPRAGWTGALLAGGRSRRMGQDKLLMRLPDGRRLCERPANALAQVCTHLLQLGRPEEPLHPGFEPLADAAGCSGPLAGLLAALEAARTPWLLLAAGDMPNLSAELLAELQQEAERDPARALLPEGPEPLCAAYPTALAPLVRARVQAGERAARAALPPQARRLWPAAAAQAAARLADPFLSLNSRSDWEAYAGRCASPLSL